MSLFKRKRKEEHANHERWLVSYADFMTLLFAFFTVMYATSEQDVKKTKQFEKSVQKFMKMGAAGESGHRVSQGQVKDAAIDSAAKDHRSKKARQFQAKVETLIESEMSEDEINRSIRDISDESAGVKITLSSDTLFGPSGAKIKKESSKVLDKIGKIILNNKRKIYIVAHTDNSKRYSTDVTDSWELGALQASRLVKYFIEKHKIDALRLVPLSYGDTRPIDDNNKVKGRTKNRRIDVFILDDGLPI